MQKGTILTILQDPRLSLDIEYSNFVELKIQQYLELLVKWNHKFNLTAEKDPDSILKRHILIPFNIPARSNQTLELWISVAVQVFRESH